MIVLRGERPRECSPTWRGMSLAIWKSTLNGKWKLLTNPVNPSFGLACLRNRYRKADRLGAWATPLRVSRLSLQQQISGRLLAAVADDVIGDLGAIRLRQGHTQI